MKSSSKVVLVVAGYALALVIAFLVLAIYMAATDGPDRQASSGMYAFGDSLLFLGVFVVAAVPATGAALFFLRPYRAFWRIATVGALAIAATGAAALGSYLVPSASQLLGAWAELSPLRILLAPMFALTYFLFIVAAPTRSSRIAFVCAGLIETIVFVWVAFIWFHSNR
jgi:hypothetical protein